VRTFTEEGVVFDCKYW